MKQRCHNPKYRGYPDYGGRGIAVCPEWFLAFEPFRDWALANGYREGLTIERGDNDGPYSPENCRWVTQKENKQNTRRNRYYEAFGERKCVSEWSRDPRCAVNLVTLNTRLRRGWSFLDALTSRAERAHGESGRFVHRPEASRQSP